MAALRFAGTHNGRDSAAYHATSALLAAANTALLLNTPLLLAGEPGCGKTDFAWYAARALATALGQPEPERAVPLECYVRSDMRARDLLYQYDALSRFADAQHPPDGQRERGQDARRYIALQPLGLGLLSRQRRVVLIDEIDKAPRDLPNDLLREMEQGQFTITEIPEVVVGEICDPGDPTIALRRHMRPAEAATRPLVIVTSNAERQLPDAFLRRCVFFHIAFPTSSELEQILTERFPERPGTPGNSAIIHDALTVATALRNPSYRLIKPPGTAEIIGFVRSLIEPDRDADWADSLPLAALARRARAEQALPWRRLPALHCLVKLKEDLDTLDRLSPKTA